MGTPKQQDKIFTEKQPFMDKSFLEIYFCCLHETGSWLYIIDHH
jgi:hypothetical protein